MEQVPQIAGFQRSPEDIALDLLKFVAGTAGITRTSGPSTGFGATGSSKPEDQIGALLGLYTRCLQTVKGE